MLRTEHRQGDGKTQIAQGHDLVEAAGARQFVLCGQQSEGEDHQASAAHQDCGAEELEEEGEKDWVHRIVESEQRLRFYDEIAFPKALRPVKNAGPQMTVNSGSHYF